MSQVLSETLHVLFEKLIFFRYISDFFLVESTTFRRTFFLKIGPERVYRAASRRLNSIINSLLRNDIFC